MQTYGMINDVVEAVKLAIPEELAGKFDISDIEVKKHNDMVKHGVVIRPIDSQIAPTIYVEDCMEMLGPDATMEQLAEDILRVGLKALEDAPVLEDLSFEYEDIKDKLVIQVADPAQNMDRLKDLAYKPIDGGMVMLAYIHAEQRDDGVFRCAVSKDLVADNGYDVDRIFEDGLANTIAKYPPVFSDLENVIFGGTERDGMDPREPDAAVRPGQKLYVVTNSAQTLGAAAIYYPEVKERIADILGDNYYALPSSIHEMIIVPEKAGLEPDELRDMVRSANREVVMKEDVLSDRIFYYDREHEKFAEHADHERDERGER